MMNHSFTIRKRFIACTECERLGNLPNRKPIGITINPWPYCRPYIDDRRYSSASKEEQKEIIDVWLQNIYDFYVHKIGLLSHMHFEQGSRGYIHAHGIISIKEDYSPDYYMPRLATEIHRQFGKKSLRSSIACQMDLHPNNQIYLYVNKENTFPPESYPKANIDDLLEVGVHPE